jgi:spore germination protein GerM
MSVRRLAAAVMVLAALALTGCGVPTGASPQAIAKSQVPFRLLAPQAPTTTPVTAPSPSFTIPVTVYLVSPSQQYLVENPRLVAPPAELSAVLDALLAGPTTSESALGIQTALSSSVRVLGASVANGVASINFNSDFGEITGPQEVLAVAQVVYTVTGQLSVATGVQFLIDGVPINVPIGTGAVVAGPVHVLQYAALAPPAASPPTTAPAA